MRTWARTAALVTLALGMAGCGLSSTDDAKPGAPQIPTPSAAPDVTTSPGPEPKQEPVQPSSALVGPAGAATAALRPCDLLTDAERREIAVEIRNEDTLGYARMCEMRATGRYALTIGIFDTLGIEDVVSQRAKKTIDVAGRPAVRFIGPLSACVVALKVSDTSRVDVIASANGDTDKGCAVALRAAARVEPKLP